MLLGIDHRVNSTEFCRDRLLISRMDGKLEYCVQLLYWIWVRAVTIGIGAYVHMHETIYFEGQFQFLTYP